jgi:hypothetical protein
MANSSTVSGRMSSTIVRDEHIPGVVEEYFLVVALKNLLDRIVILGSMDQLLEVILACVNILFRPKLLDVAAETIQYSFDEHPGWQFANVSRHDRRRFSIEPGCCFRLALLARQILPQ